MRRRSEDGTQSPRSDIISLQCSCWCPKTGKSRFWTHVPAFHRSDSGSVPGAVQYPYLSTAPQPVTVQANRKLCLRWDRSTFSQLKLRQTGRTSPKPEGRPSLYCREDTSRLSAPSNGAQGRVQDVRCLLESAPKSKHQNMAGPQ